MQFYNILFPLLKEKSRDNVRTGDKLILVVLHRPLDDDEIILGGGQKVNNRAGDSIFD